MADPRFIHLRIHSDYSMVDGLSKVPPLVKKVAELGMPAMALTDFTNLCGLVKFYNTAQGCGVKPIIGADFKMQLDEFGDELCNITALAADNEGYKNLTLLISRAYLRGHVQHIPVIDKSWLAELKQGLILISGGRHGDVGKSLLKGNQAVADQCVAFYKEHFPEAYYLELVRTGRADEEVYLHFAVEFAEKHDLPVVATNDVCFLTSDQFDVHEIRVAIHDATPSKIHAGRKITATSSIFALKMKCVSCLRIFRKRLKTRSRLPSAVTFLSALVSISCQISRPVI